MDPEDYINDERRYTSSLGEWYYDYAHQQHGPYESKDKCVQAFRQHLYLIWYN